MRIIDADELKALRELYIQGKLQFIENEYDLIDKCPTIEAEPVRHGQWLPIEIARSLGTFKGIQCSICENKKIYSGTYPLPNYCENCGAKMDLKE